MYTRLLAISVAGVLPPRSMMMPLPSLFWPLLSSVPPRMLRVM